MSTHDYVIANASGSAVRSDINNVLAAIVSNNSSSSEPSTKYAYMLWADTTNGILKIRNSANNAWIELLQLDGTLTMEDGAEATPGLAFRDDLNTGIWSSGADTLDISTAGTRRFTIDSSGRVLLGTTTEGHADADDLTVATSGTTGITIRSGTTSHGNLWFSDATSGASEYSGYVQYNHNTDQINFGVNKSQALSIDSSLNATFEKNITSNNLFGHNLIINGSMRVAQRATTNNTTGASSTYKTLDRWMMQIQSGTITESQQSTSSSDTPFQYGFTNYMRLLNQSGVGAGASQYVQMDQRIEAQDIFNSGWRWESSSSYVTLSFWVRASVAQAYIGVLRTQDGTTRHWPFEIKDSGGSTLSANTWTKISVPIYGNSGITVNNDNGSGLIVSFIPYYGTNYTSSSGSFDTWNTTGGGADQWPDMTTTWATTTNATFDITGVQLEVGSIATNFEHRSYGDELARCQRYYYVHANGNDKPVMTSANYSATTVFGHIPFPVEMRTYPSLDATTGSAYFRAYGNSTTDVFDNVSLQASSKQGYILQGDTNLSVTQGQATWVQTADGDAKIAFKAEL